MGFYTEPAFFLLLVPIVAGAAFLGLRGKPLGRYALAVSALMLVLLFSRSVAGGVFFACFAALSAVLARATVALFAREGGPAPHAVAWYRAMLAVQVAPLVVYKVGVLFEPDFLGFIGISYITFKAVQVLIEARDGLIRELPLATYLGFLLFFPTFTSGPIMRSRPFAADYGRARTRDEYLELLYRGAGWFLLGAVYKFVGATLAEWAMWFLPSVIGTASPGAFAATQLVYALAYTADLFFDFAGYSHMALGVGLALGVEVPRNFRAPFAAVDIKDFWNRWHITLSAWLRDFVFMRFSAAAFERKWLGSPLAVACSGYLINMTLMGAWHGLTPDYLLYGVYHGVLLAACELMQRKWGFYKAHKRDRWFRGCLRAVTLVAVVFGFSLFSGQVLHPIGV